jgi:hypothetical protein
VTYDSVGWDGHPPAASFLTAYEVDFGFRELYNINVGGEIHGQFEELGTITEIEIASGGTKKEATGFGQIRRAEAKACAQRRRSGKVVRDGGRDISARKIQPFI